jgi:hypothetical protein
MQKNLGKLQNRKLTKTLTKHVKQKDVQVFNLHGMNVATS